MSTSPFPASSVSAQPVIGKRATVASAIEREIRRGALRPGDRLDGENALARRFSVSRGTIRQVLEELKLRGLITTRGGIGSFVTLDGVALDHVTGWARALREAGGRVETRVVDIARVPWLEVPAVADDQDVVTSAPDAVRIRRLRVIPGEGGISYEISVIPAFGALGDLPETGLVDESIWASLDVEGLRAVSGRQDTHLVRLDDESARLLGRPVGDAFLCTDRWSYGPDGHLVEYVRAYLHPEHFRLTINFGDPA